MNIAAEMGDFLVAVEGSVFAGHMSLPAGRELDMRLDAGHFDLLERLDVLLCFPRSQLIRLAELVEPGELGHLPKPRCAFPDNKPDIDRGQKRADVRHKNKQETGY